MLKIDADLLAELGLEALPDWEKNLILEHTYESLERRVGLRLAERMSDPQLDEFERFYEERDEEGATRWLEENVPDYREVTAAEFALLKREIGEQAGAILRISFEDLPVPVPSGSGGELPVGTRPGTTDPGATSSDDSKAPTARRSARGRR